MDIEQLKRGDYFRLVEYAVNKLEKGERVRLAEAEHDTGIRDLRRFNRIAIVSEGGDTFRVREEAMIAYLQFVQLEAVQRSAESADEHAAQAMQMGRRANRTAIAAIIIGACIGIAQVAIQLASGCQ